MKYVKLVVALPPPLLECLAKKTDPTQWALQLQTMEGREGSWEKPKASLEDAPPAKAGKEAPPPKARDIPHKHVGELSPLEDTIQLAKSQPTEGTADHIEIGIILELRHHGCSLEGWLVLVLFTIGLVLLVLSVVCSHTDTYKTKTRFDDPIAPPPTLITGSFASEKQNKREITMPRDQETDRKT